MKPIRRTKAPTLAVITVIYQSRIDQINIFWSENSYPVFRNMYFLGLYFLVV